MHILKPVNVFKLIFFVKFLVTSFFKSSPDDMFIDFRERRRERVRNSDMRENLSSCLLYVLPQGPNPYAPGAGMAPQTTATWPGLYFGLLLLNSLSLNLYFWIIEI